MVNTARGYHPACPPVGDQSRRSTMDESVWTLLTAVLSLLLLAAAAPTPNATAAVEAVSGAVVEVVPGAAAVNGSGNSSRSAAMISRLEAPVSSWPSRASLSRAALLAAARAAMAARAAGAVRAAGLELPRQRATLRPFAGSSGPAAGTVLIVGPVANETEPRCANITSVNYSIDMLLGTWYVVSVISSVHLGPVCGGFQLTRLNVSSAGHDSEAVIVSRFGRQPGGPVAYVNRTMLVSSDENSGRAGSVLQEQLAVTYYAPDGRLLSITACSPEGDRLTYVYARRPSPPPADAMGALRRRLAASGVEPTTAGDVTARPTTTTTSAAAADSAEEFVARVKVLPRPTRPPFNVTECGW